MYTRIILCVGLLTSALVLSSPDTALAQPTTIYVVDPSAGPGARCTPRSAGCASYECADGRCISDGVQSYCLRNHEILCCQSDAECFADPAAMSRQCVQRRVGSMRRGFIPVSCTADADCGTFGRCNTGLGQCMTQAGFCLQEASEDIGAMCFADASAAGETIRERVQQCFSGATAGVGRWSNGDCDDDEVLNYEDLDICNAAFPSTYWNIDGDILRPPPCIDGTCPPGTECLAPSDPRADGPNTCFKPDAARLCHTSAQCPAAHPICEIFSDPSLGVVSMPGSYDNIGFCRTRSVESCAQPQPLKCHTTPSGVPAVMFAFGDCDENGIPNHIELRDCAVDDEYFPETTGPTIPDDAGMDGGMGSLVNADTDPTSNGPSFVGGGIQCTLSPLASNHVATPWLGLWALWTMCRRSQRRKKS